MIYGQYEFISQQNAKLKLCTPVALTIIFIIVDGPAAVFANRADENFALHFFAALAGFDRQMIQKHHLPGVLIRALHHFVIDKRLRLVKFALAVLKMARLAFEQFDFFAQLVGGEAAGNFQRFGLVELDKIAEAKGLGDFLRIIADATRAKGQNE